MHAHAHAHLLGRDVDLDIGNAWIIGLSMLTVAVVAVGAVLLVRDVDGAGPTTVGTAATSFTGPASIGEATAQQLEVDRLLGTAIARSGDAPQVGFESSSVLAAPR